MIEFCVEKLYHFRCNECEKWWSIGDFCKGKNTLICPYCGKKQKLVGKRK